MTACPVGETNRGNERCPHCDARPGWIHEGVRRTASALSSVATPELAAELMRRGYEVRRIELDEALARRRKGRAA